MDGKPFSEPVDVMLGNGRVAVETTQQAADLLMQDWPAERGERHRDALDTCLKVLEGHRSTADARAALTAAAEEAGILA